MRNFSFWIKLLIGALIITGVFHSLSFFVKQVAANDQERLLMDLMSNYYFDLGFGFRRSTENFMFAFSYCVSLLCFFGGAINWYFYKVNLESKKWEGFLLIQCIVFGSVFIVFIIHTFLIPILCTGIIFISVLMSYLKSKKS